MEGGAGGFGREEVVWIAQDPGEVPEAGVEGVCRRDFYDGRAFGGEDHIGEAGPVGGYDEICAGKKFNRGVEWQRVEDEPFFIREVAFQSIPELYEVADATLGLFPVD